MTPDAPEPTDEALASALRAGDDLALNTLMLRWQVRLRAFLYRHTQNEADALDLAQETFVRIYRHRANYREGARFSTWLFQIALNLARDHARSRARRPTVSLDEAFAHTSGKASEHVATQTAGNANTSANIEASLNSFATSEASGLTTAQTPSTNALAAERISAVRAAIAELPENLRESLILFEYDDRSHAEIAAIVDATPKAVETRLARARELLRKRLAKWLA